MSMLAFEVYYTKQLDKLFTTCPQQNAYYSILLCLKGQVSIYIGYHSFVLGKHMMSILSPDTTYSCEDATEDLEVVQLFFYKPFLQKMFLRDELVDELLTLNSSYPPVFKIENDFKLVAAKFDQLRQELEGKAAYHLDVIRLILLEILYTYNRACEYCLLGFQKNMNRNYQLTYQFKRLIDDNFLKWKTVGDYAAHLGITAKHLTEVVKEETSFTALQVIHERVLRESQYLLKHSSKSVKECAYILGFDDPAYFNRFFKTHTGISPNLYRDQF